MGQKSSIDKKAYLDVTDIGVDLSGETWSGLPLLKCAPSLQNGGSGVTPPRQF